MQTPTDRKGLVSLADVREDDVPRAPVARLADRTALVLVLTFVLVAPFPYGAILPGGNVIIELFAFLGAAIAFLARPPGRHLSYGALIVAALAGVAVVGVVQILPLSSGALTAISPVSAKTWADASSIMQLFGRRALTPKISIAPNETVSTVLLTLAYGALFAAAAIEFRTRLRRRALLAALLATAIGQTIYAAVSDSAVDRVHGPFVNPNHFAGYLEIALAAALGALWGEVLINRQRGEGIRDRGDRLEKRLLPLAARVLLWAVVATGIALTRSRGGLLAAFVGTIVMLVMGAARRRGHSHQRRTALAAATLAAGIVFVAFTVGKRPLLRFLSADPRDIGTDERFLIWTTSVRAWRMFPHLGSGLGAFREAFRRVQPAAVTGLVEQAHNDFLQLLVTGGWIGALLGAAAFACTAFLLIRGWRRQEHREESGFILGGFGALLMLTLHGIVDFNMSVPAIPATLAVVLGASWAATREDNLPSS